MVRGRFQLWLSLRTLKVDFHRKLQNFVAELNRLYRSHPAFYQIDYRWDGFEWVDFHDYESSIISFIRRPNGRTPFLLFCCNFTPVPRRDYRLGVPRKGQYQEIKGVLPHRRFNLPMKDYP